MDKFDFSWCPISHISIFTAVYTIPALQCLILHSSVRLICALIVYHHSYSHKQLSTRLPQTFPHSSQLQLYMSLENFAITLGKAQFQFPCHLLLMCVDYNLLSLTSARWISPMAPAAHTNGKCVCQKY